MGFKKGQAALDFLMTYGWAIALVVIIAAVLFALGIFDVSNFTGNKAAGFSGVAVKAWRVAPGGMLTLVVSNQVGVPISINAVSVTIGNTTVTNTTATSLAVGQDSSSTSPMSLSGFTSQTTGSGYTAHVVINYTDSNTNFAYATGGTLTGKVA